VSDPTRAEAAAYKSAARTTTSGLLDALVARLGEIAPAFWGLSTKSAERAPTVVAGWLPPKTGPDDERFPFLIARPRTGIDPEQSAADPGSRATFEVIVGTYSDTDDGWRDLLLVIDAIRQSFGAKPNLGGAYEHIGPLTWDIPEDQLRPQWQAVVTLQFALPRPQRVEALNPTQE
jgi:hypothetical protein